MSEESQDASSSEAPASRRRTMRISEVTGRGSSPERGLSTVHEMRASDEAGNEFEVGRFKADGETVNAKVLFAIGEYLSLDRCPICLDLYPSSREHVPPKGLGGTILISTCLRCNNEFGSKYENDLLDWFDDAVRVGFSGDVAPGVRRSPRMLIRRASDGAPALIVDTGTVDPAISAMFASGKFQMHYSPPDMRRVKIAALKSAYLAACLMFGEIPQTPIANAVREFLIQARDAPRDAPPESALLDDMRLLRTYGVAAIEVALVVVPHPDGTNGLYVSLARTLAVSWPLERDVRLVQVPPQAG